MPILRAHLKAVAPLPERKRWFALKHGGATQTVLLGVHVTNESGEYEVTVTYRWTLCYR